MKWVLALGLYLLQTIKGVIALVLVMALFNDNVSPTDTIVVIVIALLFAESIRNHFEQESHYASARQWEANMKAKLENMETRMLLVEYHNDREHNKHLDRTPQQLINVYNALYNEQIFPVYFTKEYANGLQVELNEISVHLGKLGFVIAKVDCFP
jgi:hypothetical protein